MSDRPYIDFTIDKLEELVSDNRDKIAVLGPIRVELENRHTARAKRLLREVVALVEGEMPRPKPPRAGGRGDQHGLFSSDPHEVD